MSLFAKKNDNSGDETRHFMGISSDTDFIAPHEKPVEQEEITFTFGAPEGCVDVAAAEEKSVCLRQCFTSFRWKKGLQGVGVQTPDWAWWTMEPVQVKAGVRRTL